MYRSRRQRRDYIEDLQASADFTEFEPNERSLLVGNRYVQTVPNVVNDGSSAIQQTGSFFGGRPKG